MKRFQALLIGAAVGLLAVGTASAAEQHAKGNPMVHPKNCSVYGGGFHYVPGADVCMKVGGWADAESRGGRVNWGALNSNPADQGTANGGTKERGYITTDVRQQTEYGTVRAYVSVGATHQ